MAFFTRPSAAGRLREDARLPTAACGSMSGMAVARQAAPGGPAGSVLEAVLEGRALRAERAGDEDRVGLGKEAGQPHPVQAPESHETTSTSAI
jgi:hypothetical protein